jgi:hypothetical protein
MIVSNITVCNYLDDVGREADDKEYKVFTLNPFTMGEHDGFKLLKSGYWLFDNTIERTIKSYIHTYVPKYISAFSHPKTIVKSGILYIGIDDDGLVHGIPYSKLLTEEFIRTQIILTLSKLRGANNYDCVKNYMDCVKVEIIKLNKSTCESKIKDCGLDINYNSTTYSKIKSNKKIEETKRSEYITKKHCWEKYVNSIPQKITDIMNDRQIRNQIIDLIKEKSTSTTKLNPKYKNIYAYCEIKNDYWDLILQFKSDKVFNQVTYESAEKIRNDMLSPIYWGLAWRDLKTTPSKILKPVPYRLKYNYKQYSMLMASQVPKMIPSWIKHNPELNLYVVKITFSGNISPELFLEYQDCSNNWIRVFRTSIDGEPSCQPIY